MKYAKYNLIVANTFDFRSNVYSSNAITKDKYKYKKASRGVKSLLAFYMPIYLLRFSFLYSIHQGSVLSQLLCLQGNYIANDHTLMQECYRL